MRRLMVLVIALVLGASLAACGGATKTTQSGAPGATGEDRLPAATLQPLRDSDEAVSLRDLRGPMVVNLWAQWCGPCRDELPKYEAFHRAHPEVDVLGIDWQDTQRDRAVALAKKSGLTYPLVTDPDRKIRGRGLPQLIMIDAKGKIAYQQYVEITSVAQLEKLVRQHLGSDL